MFLIDRLIVGLVGALPLSNKEGIGDILMAWQYLAII